MRVKKNNRISRRMDAFQIILYVIVAVYCLSMVYVLLFGLINSLKDATDFRIKNSAGSSTTILRYLKNSKFRA